MNAPIFVLVLLAYLLGTFPSAILVARSKGIDITTVGSGNPGASNIARTLGGATIVLHPVVFAALVVL
jgi:glycerol-3-phosphate acyltransferase PlsY